MKRLRGFALSAFCAASGVGFASGGGSVKETKSFVLRTGTLYTGEGPPMRDAAVVVRDGKFELVRTAGASLPDDLPVIDRSDSIVMPGIVLAESGLADAFEERFRGMQLGTIVVHRNVDPRRRAIDGFAFPENRSPILAAGITTAYLEPGRARVVNGRGAIIKLSGEGKERILRETADLSVGLGDAVLNPPNYFDPPLPPSAENPIVPGKRQFPRSRAGAVAALRRAFDDAIQRVKGGRVGAASEAFDPETQELGELLRARVPVRIRTGNDADARAALAILRDYGLTGVLVGAGGAAAAARELKEGGVPVVVELPVVVGGGPDASIRQEIPRDAAATAAALAEAGVRVALAFADDARTTDTVLLMAAARRAGMSREAVVRALTSDAARIVGVSDRVGSIAPGRDADFLVLGGSPCDADASVRETWVSGARVFDRAAVEEERRGVRKLDPDRGSVVVKGGLVIPMAGEPIPNGEVAIYDGKIVGVGRGVSVPPGAKVIDAGPDAVITPGLVDARSFLGLDGDGTPFAAGVPIQFLAAPGSPDVRRAALGGVTTVCVQGGAFAGGGTAIAALKTGGSWRDAVVREACGIGIPTQGVNADGYRALLRRAKEYTDRWDKYFADVDKAKEEARKAAAEGRKAEEKPVEANKEDKPDGEIEKAPVDPLTGTWEGELRGGPMPRPEPFTLKLRLKGETVSGSLSSQSPLARGQDVEFDNGTFKNDTFSVTLTRPEIPFPVKIEGRIDRPDHMTGTVNAQIVTLDFDATRTEKAAPALVQKATKRKGVEMPPVDDSLEPFRRLFKGGATLVVRADSKIDIELAVQVVVDEFKLPLAILGGQEADLVAPLLAAKKVGLVSGPQPLSGRRGRGLPLVVEAAAAGVPVAFGTESGTGAFHVSSVGAALVSRGVGADAVLRGFTVDAARIYRIDDRVGSLEPGKDGDVVVWDGLPFRGSSTARTVIVGGQVVESFGATDVKERQEEK